MVRGGAFLGISIAKASGTCPDQLSGSREGSEGSFRSAGTVNLAVPMPIPSQLHHERETAGERGTLEGKFPGMDPSWPSSLGPEFRGLVMGTQPPVRPACT